MLQRVAACCIMLQRVAVCGLQGKELVKRQLVVCYSMLQRVAACCSVLQRVAACCSVLQCVDCKAKNLSNVSSLLNLLYILLANQFTCKMIVQMTFLMFCFLYCHFFK